MSFLGKVNFNELSEVDHAIYNYMSTDSDKIPYMRVREIAAESHTSASSVMRFIRKLGYESFTEFKTHFKLDHEMTYQSSDFSRGSELLERNNFPKDIEMKLKLVAELILRADNIIFFGMGSSGAICDYAARKLATVGFNSFAYSDPTFPLFGKLRNTSSNVLITLSISGSTNEVVETVNGFKNHPDFDTVCITTEENSTLGLMSDHVLAYRTEIELLHKHEDLTSQIPCMYLVESLIREVLNMDKLF